MTIFIINDVRTTSEYEHIRYCYPSISQTRIIERLLSSQRLCFVESDHTERIVHEKRLDTATPYHGIYDMWLTNMSNVSTVTVKIVRKCSTLVVYKTQIHPSETAVQIPISMPEGTERVQTGFHHPMRDGNMHVSYIPTASFDNTSTMLVELKSSDPRLQPSADLVLSTVYLSKRNERALTSHDVIFYIDLKPYFVRHGRVTHYVPSTKKRWWEKVLPLFGRRIHTIQV